MRCADCNAQYELDSALYMVEWCRRVERDMRAGGHEHEAVAFEMNVKGYTFRARELRYDARGGMTEELARRRFEPGARWSVNVAELVVDRLNIFGLPLVHFRDVGRPVERADMTRENGWMFLDLGDANGEHVPPGGWP
jgi:hypothetical protein